MTVRPHRVVVVGGGIAGISCARRLVEQGIEVHVLDRGRQVGGRMSAPAWKGRRVDLGASYFTVGDGPFAEVVEDWRRRGLAHQWTDTFTVLEGDQRSTKVGPMRWSAPDGLRSLVVDLATGLDLHQHTVRDLDDAGDADAVVLAMPDPQARRLLPEHHPLLGSLTRTFEPVLALAARWPQRAWDTVSPDGRFEAAFVNDNSVLGWVADDGRRRGDDATVLVAHSTPEFARGHLDEPDAARPAMVAALRSVLGVDAPEDSFVHRWSFARPTGERAQTYALVEADGLVGVCGDGWGPTPKVETAWQSGRDLAEALV